MNFKRLQIPDVILCEPDFYNDNRGYFTEIYKKEELDKFLGYSVNFCQENESKSKYGVLRGLHYQLSPYAQTKLVCVKEGGIFDVVVDLRKDSKTFGNHLVIDLNSENKKLLLVPKGFAHGFVVYSKKAVVTYKSDSYYQPEYERGISYNDNILGIDWRLNSGEFIISEKDNKLPKFKNADYYESSDSLYD